MEQIQLLAVALGLAGLAGINLYLTVFVTGLSIQQGWITLLPQYSSLEVLAHPAIITVAGIFFLLEFFADKVPWVDSLWDSVHTVIRPVGAALIAIQVLGETSQVYSVIVALLGGGTALVTHSVKAATRLAVNASPEPFSNIAVSLAEDAGVLGGLALINFSPLLALGVLAAGIALALYLLPRLFRMARVQLWLILTKLRTPAGDQADPDTLTAELPADIATLFAHQTVLEEKPEWTAHCVASGSKPLPSSIFGYLIATVEEPAKLHFIGKSLFGATAETLDLTGYTAQRDSRLLSENLVLSREGARSGRYRFIFDRASATLVRRLVESINRRLATPGRATPNRPGIIRVPRSETPSAAPTDSEAENRLPSPAGHAD